MQRKQQRQQERKQQRQRDLNEEKQCYFCTHGIKEIDYKELHLIQKFVSPYAKIIPRRRTGVCAKHQRKLARAVKRARFLALIPFVAK